MRIKEIRLTEQRYKNQSKEELYQLFKNIDTETSVWRQSRRGRVNSAAVAGVQYVLNRLGYGPVTVDGWYGTEVAGAVRQFQKDNRLTVDGDAGLRTIEKMKSVAQQRGNMPGKITATPLDSALAQVGGTGATATGRSGDGTRGFDPSFTKNMTRSQATQAVVALIKQRKYKQALSVLNTDQRVPRSDDSMVELRRRAQQQ
jgi:peptidoglycan hydrolase-like protein with peptidoglycan-binding domain